MAEDTHGNAPTRRDALRYGGTLAVAGIAGCVGGSESDPSEDGTAPADADDSETPSGDGDETGYAATMAPAGTVEFDSVPDDVMVYSLLYADMAVAYGRGDAVNSLGFDADAGGRTLDAYYERLDGVSFDTEGIEQLNSGNGEIQVDRELLYELDSDLHLADPCLVASFDGWTAEDIEEIAERIGPWFGNVYSRSHSDPPEGCREDYEYYTLWEIAERVATVFRARPQFEALAAVRDEMLAEIRAGLPPESERPTVASVIFVDGTFYPSRTDTPGFGNAHVRPLGAQDAFAAEDVTFETTYDYETMLEVDPDRILHQFGIASYYDVERVRETLADHPVGSRLSAVANGRVYPSGNPVQGPLMNLFQLEMTAKQLYPDQFGEWPGYTLGEPYPEIPASEQLFDRERVAEAVGGGS